MNEPVNVAALSRLHTGRESPLWWGTAGLVLIVAMIAASFVASYFYLRLYQRDWPPPGTGYPAVGRATFEVLLLLGSCVVLRRPERRLNAGREAQWRASIGAALLLVLAALVLRAGQFTQIGFRWDAHAYGSVVWATLGFHTALMLCALIWMSAVMALFLRGFDIRRHRYVFACAALYWCFVAWVWLPLYAVLYWAPRWL